jgi:hypothetical protein
MTKIDNYLAKKSRLLLNAKGDRTVEGENSTFGNGIDFTVNGNFALLLFGENEGLEQQFISPVTIGSITIVNANLLN